MLQLQADLFSPSQRRSVACYARFRRPERMGTCTSALVVQTVWLSQASDRVSNANKRVDSADRSAAQGATASPPNTEQHAQRTMPQLRTILQRREDAHEEYRSWYGIDRRHMAFARADGTAYPGVRSSCVRSSTRSKTRTSTCRGLKIVGLKRSSRRRAAAPMFTGFVCVLVAATVGYAGCWAPRPRPGRANRARALPL